jgi:hypothetical protein
VDSDELHVLEQRLGRLHVRQRLGVEKDHEAQVFGQGLNFFHIENSALSALAIEYTLKMTGLFWRGRRNAEQVEVRRNPVKARDLWMRSMVSRSFSSAICTVTRVSHMRRVAGFSNPGYDVCVLTGDFRGATFGPFDAALATITDLRANNKAQSTVYWEPRLYYGSLPGKDGRQDI